MMFVASLWNKFASRLPLGPVRPQPRGNHFGCAQASTMQCPRCLQVQPKRCWSKGQWHAHNDAILQSSGAYVYDPTKHPDRIPGCKECMDAPMTHSPPDMNTEFKHMDPAYYDASASLLIQSEPALALIKNPIAKALLQDFAKISKLEPCSIVSPFVRPVFAELTKVVEQRVCHQLATMQCSDPLVSLRNASAMAVSWLAFSVF